MTNYCGEEGGKCVLKAAVACSNPWNLEICNAELQRTWLGLPVYSRTMGKNLRKLFDQHREQILENPAIDLEALLKSKYLYEFDRHVQCPTWGYPTEGAYYRDSQSVDALLAVRIPFLGINSEDDPVSCPNRSSVTPSPPSLAILANLPQRSLAKPVSLTRRSNRTPTPFSVLQTGADTWGHSNLAVGGGSQLLPRLSSLSCTTRSTTRRQGQRQNRMGVR
jgi:hypothetical protein